MEQKTHMATFNGHTFKGALCGLRRVTSATSEVAVTCKRCLVSLKSTSIKKKLTEHFAVHKKGIK